VGERPSANQFVSFGSFRLFPAQHLLLEEDKPIRLGSRAFGILAALVERPGELVSKDELITRIWPDTTVEEQNLTVHIAGLRKVLGDGRDGHRYIVNIPGHGYRFVAPVSKNDGAAELISRSSAGRPSHNLPARLTKMVGRDDAAHGICARLRQHRLVTLVGPGGIGKTTVGMAAAYRLVETYKDGIWFVDFASVENPSTVPHTLAFALGLSTPSDLAISELINFLRDKELLLLFDCCDRVIEAVAAIAVQLLKSAPGLAILATSREPIHANGESVWRLGPLEVPRGSGALSATQALRFSAVQLFAQCAAASLDTFELTDFDAPIVADICRRLDGIPLAIELGSGLII
jgi:DNA-binding winged helix-turn-helix (wHTH) protein